MPLEETSASTQEPIPQPVVSTDHTTQYSQEKCTLAYLNALFQTNFQIQQLNLHIAHIHSQEYTLQLQKRLEEQQQRIKKLEEELQREQTNAAFWQQKASTASEQCKTYEEQLANQNNAQVSGQAPVFIMPPTSAVMQFVPVSLTGYPVTTFSIPAHNTHVRGKSHR